MHRVSKMSRASYHIVMTRLTSLEQKLISQLRGNARASISSLAEELGVTRATVTKTMAKLENNGTILGYTVRVGTEQISETIRATSCIKLENHTTRQATSSLKGIPEIRAIHTTNGHWDLIVELECKNLINFDRVLRTIREVQGVSDSQTSLHLNTVEC